MRPFLSLVALAVLMLAVPASAEKPRAPLDCREVAGLAELLDPGAVLLFGELHGTREAPAFVANAACMALQAGHRIRVGLEVNQEEMERFETFMASRGTPADRAALLEGPFWQPEAPDGRSSQAMVELVDRLRRFRGGGHSVSLTLFDSVQFHQAGGKDRDRQMATRLAEEIGKDSDTVTLVLTGNIHSRVVPGTPWDSDFQPMGLLLSELLPKQPLALDLSWSGGSAWVCQGARPEDCGPIELSAKRPGDDWQLEVADAVTPGANKHHGWYHVGRLSASHPAATNSPGTDPAAMAEHYLSRYAAGDIDGLGSMLTEDAVFEDSVSHFEGRDAVIQGLRAVFQALTIHDVKVSQRIVAPTHVLFNTTVRFSQDGTSMGLPGKILRFDLPMAVGLKLVDGKIARHVDYVDVGAYQEQLKAQLEAKD